MAVMKKDYIQHLKQLTLLFLKWFSAPAAMYAVIFFITQPHYFTSFSTGFFLDNGDGFQNVWNIWWVNQSVVIDHANPYYTTMLHWPHGTTLVPQTMAIFNGLMAIPLMGILNFSLIQAVNFAVTFSFVMGGVTMFWFIQKLHKKYWVSLIGGALFTFSSYHFAHAFGHLQLVSFEWIPLFLLAFWTLLEKFRWRDAFFAAGALFLVLLCDYYYLFWSVMVGGAWLGWKVYKKEIAFTKKNFAVFGLFVALCLILIGPLVYSLLHLSKADGGLLGSHDPVMFGLDPLALIIPGGSWYWGELTQFYWSRIPYLAETSMFFGYGLLIVLAIAGYKRLFKRREFKFPVWLDFWWIIFIVFGLIALGPRLHIDNVEFNDFPMPYSLLETIFPTLQISGMPVRWILVALIAAIVIVTYMLSRLDMSRDKNKQLIVLFVLIMAVDLFPVQLPLTKIPTPQYVEQLKNFSGGAVLDEAAPSEPQQLRNQTVHEKPMPFGYITRLPASVDKQDRPIFVAIDQHRYADLCKDFKIRYLTEPAARQMPYLSDALIVYRDEQAKIYDLSLSSEFSSLVDEPPCHLN